MTHVIIPTSWEAEIGMTMVRYQPGQKVSETPSKQQARNGGACLESQVGKRHRKSTV
jgi:hypothetical protein